MSYWEEVLLERLYLSGGLGMPRCSLEMLKEVVAGSGSQESGGTFQDAVV